MHLPFFCVSFLLYVGYICLLLGQTWLVPEVNSRIAARVSHRRYVKLVDSHQMLNLEMSQIEMHG